MTPLALQVRQTEVLDALLSDVDSMSRGARHPIVVFDLDDTLLSTARRHIRILRQFALGLARAGRMEEAFVLAQLEPEQLHYSIGDTAEAAGIGDSGLLKELRDFWFERFFANDYVKLDAALAGAADYCREVACRGGIVAYMTGRDEAMRDGTMESLSRNGLPLPDGRGVHLILKARFDTPDLEYKTEGIARLRILGTVAGAFENEPAHINLFRDSFPEARMAFLDTKHSGRPVAVHPSIPWIKDFVRG